MPRHVCLGSGAFTFNQNTDGAPHIALVDSTLDFALTAFQCKKSRLLFACRNFFTKIGRRSPLTPRILEEKESIKFALPNEPHRFLEVFFSFTREAHDDVT